MARSSLWYLALFFSLAAPGEDRFGSATGATAAADAALARANAEASRLIQEAQRLTEQALQQDRQSAEAASRNDSEGAQSFGEQADESREQAKENLRQAALQQQQAMAAAEASMRNQAAAQAVTPKPPGNHPPGQGQAPSSPSAPEAAPNGTAPSNQGQAAPPNYAENPSSIPKGINRGNDNLDYFNGRGDGAPYRTPNETYQQAFGNGTAGSESHLNGLERFNSSTGQWEPWTGGGQVSGDHWQQGFGGHHGNPSSVWDNGMGTGGSGTATSASGGGGQLTPSLASPPSQFQSFSAPSSVLSPARTFPSSSLTGAQIFQTPFTSQGAAMQQAQMSFGGGGQWMQGYFIQESGGYFYVTPRSVPGRPFSPRGFAARGNPQIVDLRSPSIRRAVLGHE